MIRRTIILLLTLAALFMAFGCDDESKNEWPDRGEVFDQPANQVPSGGDDPEPLPEPPTYDPGEILVKFVDGVSLQNAEKLIASYGLSGEAMSHWDELETIIVHVPVGEELAWVATFEKEGVVERATTNDIVYALE